MLDLKSRVRKGFGFLSRHRFVELAGIRRYFQKVLDCFIRMIVAAIAAILLTSILLYLVRGFWFLYTLTPVGDQFIARFPREAGFLSSLTNEPILYFAFDSTRIAVKVCVIAAACCQVLYIARCFYYSRGAIGKTVWAVGIAMLAAKLFQQTWIPIDYAVAYAATIVPVLCILPYSFDMADSALPEIGSVFRKSVIMQVYNSIKSAIHRFKR